VKIRTGIDRAHINAVEISRIATGAGVSAIAVHGRTRMDFYEGAAEYATIRELAREARVPIIANGDIDSAEKAAEVLDFTRASGVMIGRGAHGSPWIFRDVNAFLETGKIPPPLLRSEIRDIILAHVTALYAFHGEAAGVRIARKHLGWYCQQHNGTEDFRPRLMAAESSSAQYALVAECFGRWALGDGSDKENNGSAREQVDAYDETQGRKAQACI
jgi:tRNA-dihydrouridine synthase B